VSLSRLQYPESEISPGIVTRKVFTFGLQNPESDHVEVLEDEGPYREVKRSQVQVCLRQVRIPQHSATVCKKRLVKKHIYNEAPKSKDIKKKPFNIKLHVEHSLKQTQRCKLHIMRKFERGFELKTKSGLNNKLILQ